MKKTMTFLLIGAAVFALTMTGCGKKPEASSSSTPQYIPSPKNSTGKSPAWKFINKGKEGGAPPSQSAPSGE